MLVVRHGAGALVAYAYELMDRGPELDRDTLVEMICERVRVLVDHGHRMAPGFQIVGQCRADPAAPHDHDVHGASS